MSGASEATLQELLQVNRDMASAISKLAGASGGSGGGGAAGGVFVEKNAKAAACVRQNIAAVCKCLGRDPSEHLALLEADALTVPLGGESTPDLVFIDPPYEIIPEVASKLFARLTEVLAAKPEALVVFEAPGEIELAPPGWTLRKRLGKGRGQPTVMFFRRDV